MKGGLKRLLIVFLIIIGILIYAYQIYLWHLFGEYLDIQAGSDINVLAVLGVFPIWIIVPYYTYALISWIITGKIYGIKDYKKLYNRIKKKKSNKVLKEDVLWQEDYKKALKEVLK